MNSIRSAESEQHGPGRRDEYPDFACWHFAELANRPSWLNFPANCFYRVTQKLVVNWPHGMPGKELMEAI